MRTRFHLILIGSLVLVLVLSTAVALSGQTRTDGVRFEKTIGLAFPSIGKVHYSDEGFINKMTGFNLALGYSVRYYSDGLLPEEFNSYWGWGTIVFLLPYVEFGVSYPFVVGDAGNLLLLDLGLVYIFPRIGVALIY